MTPEFVIEMGRRALLTAGLIALPMLAAALTVGLVVGIFQAVTQIHEMTLSFIPKIIVVGATLYFFLPWIIKVLLHYASTLYLNFGFLVK